MLSNGWERWPASTLEGIGVERVGDRELHVGQTRHRTVVDSVLSNADLYPEREIVRDAQGALTYREFVAECRTMAANLQGDAGLRPGDRVALLLSNGVSFAVSVIAAQMAGAIVVPLNTKLRAKEVEFEIKDSEPKVLLVDEEWLGIIEPLLAELHVPAIYVTGEPLPSLRRLDLLLVRRGADLSPVEIGEHDPAFICYTSGTTGSPKGAVSTHFNCTNNFLNFAAVAGLSDADRTLLMVPMFHVTGLLAQLLVLFDVGGSAVILPRYDVTHALEAIEREKITHTIGPPTMFITMMEHPDRDRFDVRSLRTIQSGSAPISPDTINAIRDWIPHARFQNTYGMTETSSIVSATPFDEAIRKAHTIGLPVPLTAVKTVDPVTGRDVGPDEPGELCHFGPQVMAGYWKRSDATAAAVRDGWMHSGDVASIDNEGFIQLLDRMKDMINRAGEKVFCVEVEAVLFEHPQVLEAAVVGVPDELYGEAVKAVIAPKAGEVIDSDEVRSFVKERLASYKVPKYVDFVEALPRNPNGKVMKSELDRTPAEASEAAR